ncbi:site-specific integrase [Cupriavidus sp. 30B13]|uniref:site-specific integrase n=1 Tax=Cupriavidus sp. 30B13 TaxID=3384241 RepID=UPI003B8F09B4
MPENRNAAGWAAYWLPLMGLYTGARSSELGKLMVADVRDMDGVHVLSIYDSKTASSERFLPIHPELVRQGFLDYVRTMREAGNKHLFPALNNTSKGPSTVFGKWYRLRFDEIGITGDLKTFHSFRHTLRSELASLHIGQETTDAIMGHARTGSTGAQVYTHIKLLGMVEALGKLKYPIDLQRVYPSRWGAPEGSGRTARAILVVPGPTCPQGLPILLQMFSLDLRFPTLREAAALRAANEDYRLPAFNRPLGTCACSVPYA